jgi:hypothetical protein
LSYNNLERFGSIFILAHTPFSLRKIMAQCAWNALMTDGESLNYIEPLLAELLAVFLSRYVC